MSLPEEMTSEEEEEEEEMEDYNQPSTSNTQQSSVSIPILKLWRFKTCQKIGIFTCYEGVEA